MCERKLPLRNLYALSMFAMLTALDMVRCLLQLVLKAFAVNIAKVLPASWLESAGHNMIVTHYIYAMGMGGEWKLCTSIANLGGYHD